MQIAGHCTLGVGWDGWSPAQRVVPLREWSRAKASRVLCACVILPKRDKRAGGLSSRSETRVSRYKA